MSKKNEPILVEAIPLGPINDSNQNGDFGIPQVEAIRNSTSFRNMTGRDSIGLRTDGTIIMNSTTTLMAEIFRRSRLTKCFTIVDMILIILLTLTLNNPYLLIAIIFPLSGYFGCQKYDVKLLLPYMLYTIVAMGISIYSFSSSLNILPLVYIILYLMITYWVFILCKYIKQLSPTEREELIDTERSV